MRRVLLACLLVCISSTAQAGIYIVPVMPYTPYQPYYVRPEPYMEVDSQYFELNLSGLQRMCRASPELCELPEQRRDLRSLRNRRATGIALLVTGIAGAVAGTVWTATSTRYDDFGYVQSANYTPLIVGLSMGLSLPIIGGVIMPHYDDIVDFVNRANALHGERPIRLNLGMNPGSGPSLALSLKF